MHGVEVVRGRVVGVVQNNVAREVLVLRICRRNRPREADRRRPIRLAPREERHVLRGAVGTTGALKASSQPSCSVVAAPLTYPETTSTLECVAGSEEKPTATHPVA